MTFSGLPCRLVKLLQLGEAFGHELFGPVVGTCECHWPRGDHPGDLDVAGSDAKERAVLADATALHPGGDHDGREAAVECDHRSRRVMNVCVPPPLPRSRRAALRIDIRASRRGSRGRGCYSRFAGPGVLQAAVRPRHRSATLACGMASRHRAPDHVVVEDDAAEPGEARRESRHFKG